MQRGVRVVGDRAAPRGCKMLPAAFAVVLLTAGCGLRVNSSTVKAATQAAVNAPQVVASSPGATQAGGGPQGGVNSTGPSAANNTTPGQTSSSTPSNSSSGSNVASETQTSSAGSQTSTSGGSPTDQLAPPAPPGGNGGSTDVGVTATSIKVGNVSDVGGPVPGLFQGGPFGTEAYFDYINSLGGVYGRKLVLDSQDSQLDCSTDEADYANLVGNVFAFVGGWSLNDECGAQVMAKNTGVPLVNQVTNATAAALPDEYSVNPYGAGAASGPYLYFKQKFPDAITKVGTIVGNQASAVQAWKYQEHTMESLGYKVVYEDDFAPTTTNFTADVVKMKGLGVQMVYIIAVNAPDLAIFSQEAAQQGFKPKVFASGIGYFAGYVSQSGGASAVEGQYVNVVQARFLGEDAAAVPEVGLFDQWMKQEFPNFAVDQFADTSWANAALFVHALVAAGPHVTRAEVLQALSQTHDFQDNGMVAPNDVANKTPGHCYMILQIHNGQYEKVDDPADGSYRCDGAFVPGA